MPYICTDGLPPEYGSHEQAVSPMTFPSQRSGNRAVQAVQVTSLADKARLFIYTFCLERIDVGPYKAGACCHGLQMGLQEDDIT